MRGKGRTVGKRRGEPGQRGTRDRGSGAPNASRNGLGEPFRLRLLRKKKKEPLRDDPGGLGGLMDHAREGRPDLWGRSRSPERGTNEEEGEKKASGCQGGSLHTSPKGTAWPGKEFARKKNRILVLVREKKPKGRGC